MAAQERREYHWIGNRVVERIISRPRGTVSWHFDKYEPTLVATIEEQDRSFYLREGRASTPERIVDAVRLYKGVLVDDSIPDFSGRMPGEVQEELRRRVNGAIISVTSQWGSFAEETDMTGHLKGELIKIDFERLGWSVAVKSWTYKRYPKEDKTGADLGIIFDIKLGEDRLIKAIWYQAKIVRGIPSSLDNVPDLADQVAKMGKFTKEHYTLLYSPDGMVTTRGMDVSSFQPLADNLVDGAICVRGDRNPRVVADTVDVKRVVTFFISGPNAGASQ